MHQPDPQSRSYTQVISAIELGTMKIPQFQREFVWAREKSAKLIDSILKGYPIGTFILWKTREQLRFVRNLGGIELPPTPAGDYAEQVLDGQQRLTSLYAAVKGLDLDRGGGTRDDFSLICIDLDSETDADASLVLPDTPANALPGRFVPLVHVLGEDFDLLSTLTPTRRERLRAYSRRIKEYRFSVILIQDAPIDVATEIFTRINVTGKPLFMFEIMVAKTFDHDSGFDLAQRYADLLDELRSVEYETIPPSSILQIASLVLSGTGEARKKDILRLHTAEFRKAWPAVEDAVRSACDYLRDVFRIPASRLLPYGALIVPIAAFFYLHPDKPSGPQISAPRELFWRISLTGRYTSATETKLAQDFKRIEAIATGKETSYDQTFAVDISPDAIRRHGTFRTSRSFVKAVLCLLAFHQPRSFDTDGIVRVDNDWLKRANSRNYHHFFPKALFRSESSEKVNHVANITIVDDFLNKRKIKTRRPSDYMKDFAKHNPRLSKTMATHLIKLEDGVWDDDYDRFFEARCRAISQALHEWIPTRPIDKGAMLGPSDDTDPDAEEDIEVEEAGE